MHLPNPIARGYRQKRTRHDFRSTEPSSMALTSGCLMTDLAVVYKHIFTAPRP